MGMLHEDCGKCRCWKCRWYGTDNCLRDKMRPCERCESGKKFKTDFVLQKNIWDCGGFQKASEIVIKVRG